MPLILVVDDDAGTRVAVRRMLEPAGFEVAEAADGRQAERAFRRRPADLVPCDLFMPEVDGIELIRRFAAEFPGAKVVAVSGGGFGGRLDPLPQALALGAAAALDKPFEQAGLLRAVRRGLAAPPADGPKGHGGR